MMTLAERLATLSDAMRGNQQLMVRIAEQQTAIAPVLKRLSEPRGAADVDEAMRGHLRNIEVYLQRLLAETEQGRTQSLSELRNDIRLLTRTVAALAEPPQS